MTEDWLEELCRLAQESGQYDMVPLEPEYSKVIEEDFWELVDIQPVPESVFDRVDKLREKAVKGKGAS